MAAGSREESQDVEPPEAIKIRGADHFSEALPMNSTLAAPRIAGAVAGLMLALSGCGGIGNLAPDSPPGVDLAGVWRLNVAASDDPRKVLERLTPHGASAPSSAAPRSGRRSRRGGQDPSQGSGQGGQQSAEDPYANVLPMPRSPLPFIPNSDLLRNEVLAIKQRPDAFVIDYGTSVRRLTPGARSVISVPGGVADQSTGWKGKQYVVEIRSQVGPDVKEQYSLSQKSGKQLIVKMRLSGWSFPNVELTRVYDPAGAAAPRGLPSID